MNKKDLKRFEKRLHEELASVARSMGKIEKAAFERSQRDSSGDLSAYSIHMADLGTDASERERDFLLASAEGRIVLEIREALGRIRDGSYGVCLDCGKAIGVKRLDLLPYASFCAKCQVKSERSGG